LSFASRLYPFANESNLSRSRSHSGKGGITEYVKRQEQVNEIPAEVAVKSE
jgi:hypothetical protein